MTERFYRTVQTIQIRNADLSSSTDLAHVISLIDAYAKDDCGRREGLSEHVKARLSQTLPLATGVQALLAMRGVEAVAVCVMIAGFATWLGGPVLNVHDLWVQPSCRRMGIASHLLKSAIQRARRSGCVKVTLEVAPSNRAAQTLYQSLGFSRQMEFWQLAL